MSAAAETIDTELETFRAEARAWLDKNFPPSLKGKSAMMAGEDGPSTAPIRQVEEGDGRQGLGTPTYPKQYGGGGLRRAGARVLQQEMNARRLQSDRRHGRDDVRPDAAPNMATRSRRKSTFPAL